MGYTAEDEALIKEKWDALLFSCTKICKNDEAERVSSTLRKYSACSEVSALNTPDIFVSPSTIPAGALLHQERTGRPLHEIPVSAAIRRNHTETPGERSLAQGIQPLALGIEIQSRRRSGLGV